MRSANILLLLAAFVAPPSWAADLTKIERSIRKEPAYQTKTPKYCLLVFGSQAKTRVWLVLDGTTLYVDRNGNGDLTDDGEKIVGKDGRKDLAENIFDIGEIIDGQRTHKQLLLRLRKIDYLAEQFSEVKQWLAKSPGSMGYYLTADIELPGWKGDGADGRVQQFACLHDASGVLAFAGRPQEAPIIHFGGPWRISLFYRPQLTIGGETDLYLGVGTPGLGDGTTAYIAFNRVIPEHSYPRVEITYPPKRPGEKPKKQLYELKERC